MAFRLAFTVMFSLSVVVPSVIADSDWSWSDDLPAPETEFPSIDEGLAFSQPDLFMDSTSSPQDGSDLLFGDMDSSDVFSSDHDSTSESFALADCSSSELSPATGISRMRRRDGAAGCQSPTLTPPNAAIPSFEATRDPAWGMRSLEKLFSTAKKDLDRNSACEMISEGLLLRGACYSGEDAVPAGLLTVGRLVFLSYTLQGCTPGTLKRSSSLS